MSKTNTPTTTGRASAFKAIAALVLICAVVVAYRTWAGELTLENLARQEASFRTLERNHAVAFYLAAFAFYAVVTGASIPGAAVLSMAYGWYFGFARAFVIVILGATTGATIAFLLSRFLLRGFFERRLGRQFRRIRSWMDREGPIVLVSLRLLPAFPFFVVNAVIGLTNIRVRTYVILSFLGMIPGVAIYTYAGSVVPRLDDLRQKGLSSAFSATQVSSITIAFVLLAIAPYVLRWAVPAVLRKGRASSDRSESPTSFPSSDDLPE